jgi:AraC-like DNA-binding protein
VLDDPLLTGLLSQFHDSISRRRVQAECEALLLRALSRLIVAYADPRVAPKPIGRERPAVKRAREYLEANFARDVSLSELAGLVSFSPYYFARTFERETGLPPHAYLEGVRIRQARDLLDRGRPLADTALSVGYADQSHLTRRFKRFLGITPGQYAAQSRIRQDARPEI